MITKHAVNPFNRPYEIRVENKRTSAANKTMHAVAKAFVVVECTPSLTCVTCVHKTHGTSV